MFLHFYSCIQLRVQKIRLTVSSDGSQVASEPASPSNLSPQCPGKAGDSLLTPYRDKELKHLWCHSRRIHVRSEHEASRSLRKN